MAFNEETKKRLISTDWVCHRGCCTLAKKALTCCLRPRYIAKRLIQLENCRAALGNVPEIGFLYD